MSNGTKIAPVLDHNVTDFYLNLHIASTWIQYAREKK